MAMSLDVLDGGLLGVTMDFVDRRSLASGLLAASRLCFSTGICHRASYRAPAADWRAAALGSLFEHDKRMGRAVAMGECIINASRADDQTPENFETMALRTQMVSALESAVAAAGRHADECASANTELQRHAGKLSRFLAWLKRQRPSVLPGDPSSAPGEELLRHRYACQEMEEFGRRLSLLLRASQTFAALMGGSSGAMARHKRLYKVVRIARLAQPAPWAERLEARCVEILDAWRQAARKLDAVVCSVRMRGVAFVDLACGCTDRRVLAAAVAAAGAEDTSSEARLGHGPSAPAERSAKLHVLTAIAALTASGQEGEVDLTRGCA